MARRLQADQHLQVEVGDVADQAGTCKVSGQVRQVFKGKSVAGDSLAFALPCATDSFWPVEKLRAARLLEVFLKHSLSGLEAVDDGDALCVAASEAEEDKDGDDETVANVEFPDDISSSDSPFNLSTSFGTASPVKMWIPFRSE